MQDLLERPDSDKCSENIYTGYRGPSQLEPQQELPGFFDGEISYIRREIEKLGQQLTDLALRAPAATFGWFFESERPWWPEHKQRE